MDFKGPLLKLCSGERKILNIKTDILAIIRMCVTSRSGRKHLERKSIEGL